MAFLDGVGPRPGMRPFDSLRFWRARFGQRVTRNDDHAQTHSHGDAGQRDRSRHDAPRPSERAAGQRDQVASPFPAPSDVDESPVRDGRRPGGRVCDGRSCDDLPFSIGIEVKGVSLSGSFKDCDEYQVSFNSYIPGSYKIRYDQGFIFDTGAREAGYQAAYKTLAGSSVAFDEYQRLEMARWTYPAKTCESTNSNNTCTP